MTVGSQQGDQKLRDKPSSEGGEKLKDFRMIGGEQRSEVRFGISQLRGQLYVFSISPSVFLVPGGHTFF